MHSFPPHMASEGDVLVLLFPDEPSQLREASGRVRVTELGLDRTGIQTRACQLQLSPATDLRRGILGEGALLGNLLCDVSAQPGAAPPLRPTWSV